MWELDEEGLRRVKEKWTSEEVRKRLSYFLGELDESELAEGQPTGFLIGIKALRHGNREKAMAAFQQLSDTGYRMYYNYALGDAILHEMKRRPDWPKLVRKED